MQKMISHSDDLIDVVDAQRISAFQGLDDAKRGLNGQFPTPKPIAVMMAGTFGSSPKEITLLDPGAGIGSLTAAFIQETLSRETLPTCITAYAYEIEPMLLPHLRNTMGLCETACNSRGVLFRAHVIDRDFVGDARDMLVSGLLANTPSFNRAILNPPYYKINSNSEARRLLRSAGIETSNIYAGFVALVIKLLTAEGEMVAITPRSFCNGPYFKPFRDILIDNMDIRRIHVFHSRSKSFKDDDVLQENIIFHARKSSQQGDITISSSVSGNDPHVEQHIVSKNEVVVPGDADRVIHITSASEDRHVAKRARGLPCKLSELGLSVSTGRVVDFRAKTFVVSEPAVNVVPLIYPRHFRNGQVEWSPEAPLPVSGIIDCSETADLLVPNDVYVLVKRFTAKEEKRRVVACVYDPTKIGIKPKHVGFENHLNYFHSEGQGLQLVEAKGLALFLNSSLVDSYFRQFSGHTQVNATDLRAMRYPSAAQLRQMGKSFQVQMPGQDEIDGIISSVMGC